MGNRCTKALIRVPNQTMGRLDGDLNGGTSERLYFLQGELKRCSSRAVYPPPTNSGDGGEREIGEGFWRRRRLAGANENERAIVTRASTSVSIAASRSPAGDETGGFVVGCLESVIGGGVSASAGCLRRRENGNATRLILPVVLCLS